MLDEILESWANEKPPLSFSDVFDHFEKALKKGKERSTVELGKELSTVEKGKELSTVDKVPLRGLQTYMKLLNNGKQAKEKSEDEVYLEWLIDHLLRNNKTREDRYLIETFRDYLNAFEHKNPLKRKSESPF
ncbi:unnamed protein product [Peronospora farinosa]|uniref:Uncharacterized protein n=1 Tax=Peronospora farinosa TaxID=134698 RepID=A0ABN8BSU1_9STRA|nr:unnamed protein product [Peronospora farinosa]